jgi:[ribosomal protein S5]-alanine N-acetyltransferase
VAGRWDWGRGSSSPLRLSSSPPPSIPVDEVAVLRPWRLDDAEAVVAAFQDAEIQRWHVRRADSADEARGWMTAWQDSWRVESEGHWALVDYATDILLGRVALKGVDLRDGTAGLAYWMVASACGRGSFNQVKSRETVG